MIDFWCKPTTELHKKKSKFAQVLDLAAEQGFSATEPERGFNGVDQPPVKWVDLDPFFGLPVFSPNRVLACRHFTITVMRC
jgi:hypothetical protein